MHNGEALLFEHSSLNRLGAALTYAEKGLRVLPTCPVGETGIPLCGLSRQRCRPGKHPLVPRDKATTDTEKIREWWTHTPNAGVAVVTGYFPDREVWLVAFDDDEEGEALRRYEAEHGRVPGPRWRTGSGGIRVLAWSREPIATDRTTFEGLEILGHGEGTRTVGGIAVLLGRNENGAYEELESKVEDGIPVLEDEAPAWAETLTGPQAAADQTPSRNVEKRTEHRSGRTHDEYWWKWVAQNDGKKLWLALLQGDSIAEANRNTTLFRMGRSLLTWYASPDTIRALLTYANGAKCVDKAGELAPLDPDEVDQIVENVLRKRPGPSGTRSPDPIFYEHVHDPEHAYPCEIPEWLLRCEGIDGSSHAVECGDCISCKVRRFSCCIPNAMKEIVDEHGLTTLVRVRDASPDGFQSRVLSRWRDKARRQGGTFTYAYVRVPDGYLLFTSTDKDALRENYEAYPVPFTINVERVRDGIEAKETIQGQVSILSLEYGVSVAHQEEGFPPGPTDNPLSTLSLGKGAHVIEASNDVDVPRYATKPPVIAAEVPVRTLLRVKGEWVPVDTQEGIARARGILAEESASTKSTEESTQASYPEGGSPKVTGTSGKRYGRGRAPSGCPSGSGPEMKSKPGPRRGTSYDSTRNPTT